MLEKPLEISLSEREHFGLKDEKTIALKLKKQIGSKKGKKQKKNLQSLNFMAVYLALKTYRIIRLTSKEKKLKFCFFFLNVIYSEKKRQRRGGA